MKLYDEDVLLQIVRRSKEPWDLFVTDFKKNYGREPEMGKGPEWDAFMTGLAAAHGILMSGQHKWWE